MFFNVNIQVSFLRERQRALITKVRFVICMHFMWHFKTLNSEKDLVEKL